ncbi:alpha-ketoglutarate-dependent 2,4-dichlorophenoxyacetate dioxygenase [Calocera viscosa TUFC12733]|uniref:Alpha-ketoglutarate-dependent 2,4-dichlorophenoxyacetate dioxygenase n=1 Tax=Calocera viscosa (strain TUFC12733) TaxID=1330018 RepID=A0A167P1Z7_CALVF|nr:alpha-ketoglutarate-dependent 2,4-dichlorophenoxyacetate dioxygenase [Calocera viscosa TUFC12733]
MEPIKIGSLTCKPLHPTFVAEISGVDFSQVPLPQNVIDDLVAAQNRFAITVYRDTGLDDARHVKFSQQLNECELCPKFGGPAQPDRFSDPHLFDAGNMNLDGTLIQKDTRRWWYNKGNALWHTDSSFNQHRSKYSLLLAHLVPQEGGDTQFADVRSAYDDLPQEKKDELEDLVIEHDLWWSRQIAAPEEFKNVTQHEKNAKQPAYHKLVQVGPDGRKTMFIAAHAKRVMGWSQEKSTKLINELLAHCTQPKYTVAVKWYHPGQLVWWDNRISMHRATPFSDQMEKRDMRRTTVFDDGPDAYGVPDAPQMELGGSLPPA